MFREVLEEYLCLKIPLKSVNDIESAIVEFNYAVINT